MAFKILDAIRRALKDAQQRKLPQNIRMIDGKPYAYCYVRKMWRRVHFKGESL